MSKFKRWTPEDEQRLTELTGVMTVRQIAQELGRSIDSVNHMRRRKGLTNKPNIDAYKDWEIQLMRDWAASHTTWVGIPLSRSRASIKYKAVNMGIKLQKKKRKPRQIKQVAPVLPGFDDKDQEQAMYARSLTKLFAGHTIYEA